MSTDYVAAEAVSFVGGKRLDPFQDKQLAKLHVVKDVSQDRQSDEVNGGADRTSNRDDMFWRESRLF
jgi:hypothetical protein